MCLSRGSLKTGIAVSLCLGVFALTAIPAFAVIPTHALNLGPEDQSKQITVTVWLKPHNKPASMHWSARCMTRPLRTTINF